MRKINTKFKGVCFMATALVLSLGCFLPKGVVNATPSSLEMISLDTTGGLGNNSSSGTWDISDDGRYVLFPSAASDLVSGDTNNATDLFVRDTVNDTTERISVDTNEAQANGQSDKGKMSADGRYVVFRSSATNLVSGDTNSVDDVFIRDRTSGTTALISIDSTGGPANNNSLDPDVSNDGRFVTFSSNASDLVSGDTNVNMDVFVRDLLKGQTTRISISQGGTQGDGQSAPSRISCDGRYIAFVSAATNLVASDTNGVRDTFLYDSLGGILTNVTISGNNISDLSDITCNGEELIMHSYATNLVAGDTNGNIDVLKYDVRANTFSRVSVADDESQSNGDSIVGMVSGDGRYIVFESAATNLIASDTNAKKDIFLRDTTGGTTTRLSEKADGTQANDQSFYSLISGDGKYVAFSTEATNLVAGDTNGFGDIFFADTGNSPNGCF